MSEVSLPRRADPQVDPSPFTLWFLATLPVDNVVVLVLVSGLGLGQAVGQVLTLAMFVFAYRMDLGAFRKARPGLVGGLRWLWIFLPVYLFKRCRRGGGSMAPFWVHLGLLAVTVAVAVAGAALVVRGQVEARSQARSTRERAVLAAPSFPEDPEAQEGVADDVLVKFPRDARARLAKARALHDRGVDGEAGSVLVALLADRRAVARFPREAYEAVALLARIRAGDGDGDGARVLAGSVCRSLDPEAERARRSLSGSDLCPHVAAPRSPGVDVPVTVVRAHPVELGGASAEPAAAPATAAPPAAPAIGASAAGVASSRIRVEEAMATLVAQGMPSRAVEGWTVFQDARRRASWIFPARSDPAWPVLGIRRVVSKGGVTTSDTKLVCEATPERCMGFARRIAAFELRAFGVWSGARR